MFATLLLALACLQQPAAEEPPGFLVLLMDDVGVDRIAAYGAHPEPARTPNIDRLAESGLLFRRAYVNPTCSPTRGILLTGQYGFRTGMTRIVRRTGPRTELRSETLVPRMLEGYASAALGKWHLGQDPRHPLECGFDYFAGSQENLYGGHYDWDKNTNGEVRRTQVYATTDTADETIAAMQRLPRPWFVYTAFNAAHGPVHRPPEGLHTYDLPEDPGSDVPLCTRAAIEAMDTEIGRILAAVPSGTFVFLLGDNGTAGMAADDPSEADGLKGSLAEGGVHVPLIVAGPGVVRGECDALVSGVDLYATLAALAGIEAATPDSVSFAPYLTDPDAPRRRETVFSERMKVDGHWGAIRGERFKLVRRLVPRGAPDELYDLRDDPGEERELLGAGALSEEAAATYDFLAREMPVGRARNPR